MKKLLCTVAVLFSLACALPVFAASTYYASTTIGSVSPEQTLMLDLIRAVNSETHLSVINTDLNQSVIDIYKLGDGDAIAFSNGTASYTLSNSWDYSVALITGLPAGNYRVALEVSADDYPPYHSETHSYFYGYYGGVWIDIGSNYEAWGGADIFVQ